MLKHLSAILLVMLTASPSAARSNQDADALVHEIGSRLKILRSCEQRMWPRAFLSKVNLILVKPTQAQAWVVTGIDAPEALAWADVPDELKSGSFGFDKFGGLEAVGLNIEKQISEGKRPADYFFGLAIHETFHLVAQRDWVHSQGSGSRAALYPGPWKPRLYRQELLHSLIAAYKDRRNEPKALSDAAYWNSLYATESSDEYTRLAQTDITEGSAEYVEAVGEAISRLGCSATDEELEAELLKEVIATEQYITVKQKAVSADDESYNLGLLAGLLLRRAGVRDWEKDVEQARRPTDLLLRPITPGSPVPKYTDRIKQTLAEFDAKAAAHIEPVLRDKNSKNFVRVQYVYEYMMGSFKTQGFVDLAADPNTRFVLAMGAKFRSPDGQTEFTVQELTTVRDGSGPCRGKFEYFLIPADQVSEIADGKFRLASKFAQGVIKARKVTDEQGLDWLCIGE